MVLFVGTFPGLDANLFFIPLYLQALLLHPAFPSYLSDSLRLFLTLPTVYLAYFAPFSGSFTPRRQTHGVNFVLGVLSLSQAWKAIEWGLAKDRTPYTWIGYSEEADRAASGGTPSPSEDEDESSATNDNNSSDARPRKNHKPSRQELLRLRRQSAAHDSFFQILVAPLHILASPRGIGYAYGPPSSTLARPFVRSRFLRQIVPPLVGTHIAVLACVGWVLASEDDREAVLARILPVQTIALASLATATLATGLAVFSGLATGYYTLTLLAYCFTTLFGLQFDTRAYPPLLNSPQKTRSVAELWSIRWHVLFTRSFRCLSFDPAARIARALGVSKIVGKTVGALMVFALSGWLHEHGLWTATYDRGVPPPDSIVDRWGVMAYFMLQGVAVIFEGVFRAVTGRKVGGAFGLVWTLCVVAGGGVMVHRAWVANGLFLNLPPVQEWSWARWTVPLACMLPGPFGTKASSILI